MDPILEKFAAMKFTYPDDNAALAELKGRLVATGRKRDLIPYSKLVEGVTFRLPNVAQGEPFQIGGEWSDLDRAVVGSFLGKISADSYAQGGFLASALAVSKTTDEPSEGFRALVKELGLLRTARRDDCILFWSAQVAKAYDWYAD